MANNGDFDSRKTPVKVEVITHFDPKGAFAWVKFEGIRLHLREQPFFMNHVSGYRNHASDEEVFQRLAVSILYSKSLPGDREIFNLGARDEIIIRTLLDEPRSPKDHFSEIASVIDKILTGCGYEVSLTKAKA